MAHWKLSTCRIAMDTSCIVYAQVPSRHFLMDMHRSQGEKTVKRFIVKLIVIATLGTALLLPVASASHAHALIACNPLLHFPCTGGGIVCVDKHGHVHRFHGVVHRGCHCIAFYDKI